MKIETKKQNWKDHIGQRLLVTDRMTHIARNEWTLLEISPNGKMAKFRNELADCLFWNDLEDLLVVDILPPKVRRAHNIITFTTNTSDIDLQSIYNGIIPIRTWKYPN